MAATPYIDIHTHNLNFFQEIKAIVNISLFEDNTNINNNLNYSVGLHPWNIKEERLSIEQSLISETKKLKAIAIGEIGLDKAISTNLLVQENIFTSQIKIARQLRKPVIIHCVRAFSELLKIKKKHESHTAWIIHGYQKNIEIASNLLKADCYLSFGEAILRNKKLQQVFKQIPNDKFFLETDDSELSIMKIYDKAAEIKEIRLEDLKKQIQINYNTCFKSYE
ncbi:TatD family hydrolase [Marinifilum sp. RC60d5]|uniref:TatD family hydrolase n=1 Tax=Marinifilum sp. RC60d5 TaxID=3458414 RepID=UPI004036F90F